MKYSLFKRRNKKPIVNITQSCYKLVFKLYCLVDLPLHEEKNGQSCSKCLTAASHVQEKNYFTGKSCSCVKELARGDPFENFIPDDRNFIASKY